MWKKKQIVRKKERRTRNCALEKGAREVRRYVKTMYSMSYMTIPCISVQEVVFFVKRRFEPFDLN